MIKRWQKKRSSVRMHERFIGTACLNCGELLTNRYCGYCGQPAADVKQTLRGLIKDYGSSAFSIDALVWKTLHCLLFRPGHLTLEYLSGRRAAYIAPLRLYLTWSFLYFLILSFVPAENVGVTINYNDDEGNDITGELTVAQRDSLLEAIDVNGILYSAGIVDSTTGVDRFSVANDEVVIDGERMEDIQSGVMKHMPRAMFFLVPFSALLIQLFYIRRRLPYLNHLICALGLHTFGYVVLSLAQLVMLVVAGANQNVAQVMLLLIAIYTTLAFRKIYGGSWRKTIGKVVTLSLMYLAILGLTISAIYFLFFQILK